MAGKEARENLNKKGLFTRARRRFRLIYLRLLRIDDPPERIARGAAIGVLMGILPTFGLGIVLSIALAFALRANKAAAILGSFVMNPFTSPFFWTISAIVGALVLREDSSAIMAHIRDKSMLNGVSWAYFVHMVGNIIVSALFTLITYYLVKRFIMEHRAHKAAKRLAREKEERDILNH